MTDNNRDTSDLFDSIISRDYDTLTSLLARGANPNAIEDGLTPLLFATMEGDTRSVLLLLDHGAQIHARDDYSDDSALHCACASQNAAPLLELLLSRGCNPNHKNRDGYTALDVAASHGDDVEAVRMLLRAGSSCQQSSRILIRRMLEGCEKNK